MDVRVKRDRDDVRYPEGPDHPLFTPKQYNCQCCGKLNINRFNCHECLRDRLDHLLGGIDE